MQWDHHCRSPLDVCDVILEALGDPGQCLGHLCLEGLSMHGEAPLRLVQLGAFDPAQARAVTPQQAGQLTPQQLSGASGPVREILERLGDEDYVP